jgi:hypothetical protein
VNVISNAKCRNIWRANFLGEHEEDDKATNMFEVGEEMMGEGVRRWK